MKTGSVSGQAHLWQGHPRVQAETASPSGTKMELNENGKSSVTKPSPW
jgi:hypothetical protein